MSALAAHETLPMYAVSDSLAPRLDSLGLREAAASLERDGYAVLRGVAPIALTMRVREAIHRLVQETEGAAKGHAAGLLLGRDPVFTDVVMNPSLLAIAELMVGQGALLSQLIGTVRTEGAPALGIHADQSWMPAPFPEHNQLVTFCWTCDDFTAEGGATRVIPGSHLHRRHPSPEESAAGEGAIPIECPAGSVAVWDGSVWHGNLPRVIPGERVVLHVTYSRLALRPVEDYRHLGDEWLADQDARLASLLGRTDFFGSTTITSGGSDMRRFAVTSLQSRR